jgi:hypothetical protein
MGVFDLFRTGQSDAQDRINLVAENNELTEEVSYLRHEVREVQEDFLRISDAFDNAGWMPLTEVESLEMPLRTVKKAAKISRSLQALNPFVKRGVEARIGYIWGRGVVFDGVDVINTELTDNRKKLFTPQAYHELERVLATDGNAFTCLPIETPTNTKNFATAFRIPLEQINGLVSNPLDREDIWFYKRIYNIRATNAQTGVETSTPMIRYYVSITYYNLLKKQGKSLPKKFNSIGVEQNFVLQHTAVNRQVGWRWGVPDIMPVIFWAKAYKEYLEDNANLVKAYSRLAWQIKAPTAAGVNAAAAQVMRAPTRDPLTGEVQSVGGTAISGLGSQLSPITATGSSVDFSKGAALASAVAAGLEVPLIVITSDSGNSNRSAAESLDLPTLKAMESRQNVHTERFLEIFEFWGANIIPESSDTAGEKEISEAKVGEPIEDPLTAKPKAPPKKAKASQDSSPDVAVVTWPQIEADTTKDRITAIGTAVELGILYKQEARKDVISVLGIAPYKDWDDLPTMADDPAAQQAAQQAQALQQSMAIVNGQGTVTEKTAPPAPGGGGSAVAKQGGSGGVAAKGKAQTSPNAARTARKKDTGNS